MKDIIENDLLLEKNIAIENEQMPNGETRFRVRWSDYSGVNITNSSDTPSWQNAHYHKVCKELYVVQKGKILIALDNDDKVDYKELQKGELFLIEPFIKHNVYMFSDTMTYVLKFGDVVRDDWFYAEKLDEISKLKLPT